MTKDAAINGRLRGKFRKNNESPTNNLRRRSLIRNIHNDLAENDDEAERSLLVEEERPAAAVSATPSVTSRSSLTSISSPQKEHFQGCLKLFAENRITKDNAWNLQLIDFMSTMVRRHDARIESFQTASTMVDASTKIYAIRVDAVHFDVLKMASGLCKAAQSKRGKKDDDECTDEAGMPTQNDAVPTRRKKKAKGAVASNPEAFNGELDLNECCDPLFESLLTVGDVTASNRAFNATLQIDDKTNSLIHRMEESFLKLENKENIPEVLQLKERVVITESMIPEWSDKQLICEPFNNFSISNWDPETEDGDAEGHVRNWMEEQNRLNLSQQAVAFDVDAEVEPIPLHDQHNDIFEEEPLGGLESEEEADCAVAVAAQRAAGAGGAAQLARLTDARPADPAHARLEYSYCAAILAAWAGPKHWKLKNNRASKPCITERTQSLAAETKKPTKTKKQLDFVNAGICFDGNKAKTGEYETANSAKITISRKTLSTAPTWQENNFKTPVDRGFDEEHYKRLFLKERVRLLTRRELQQTAPVPAPPPDPAPHVPYNYDNENDASYCTNLPPCEEDWAGEEHAVGGPHEQSRAADAELGEMVEPPTKVAKIFIPYAMRAKKVDMKQLKHNTWKLLTESSQDGDNVKETTFGSVYLKIPPKLTPSMREAVSVPLMLLSVLHIANERGLILEKHDDLKDFSIKGLIRNEL